MSGDDERWRSQYGERCEGRVDPEHHREHADHEQHVRQQHGQDLHQHCLGRGDVAGHSGREIANPVFAVESQ